MRLVSIVSGERVWFESLTGTVRGEKKWAETRVHGSGGGGYVSGGQGTIAPVTVTSTVTTRHEFWIVSHNGREHPLTFANSAVNVREGQMVSVLWGAKEGRQTGPYLLLRNHSANADTVLDGRTTRTLKSMGLDTPGGWYPVFGGALTFCLSVVISLFAAGSMRQSSLDALPLFILVLTVLGFALGFRQMTRIRSARWTSVLNAAVQEIGSLPVPNAGTRSYR